MRTLQLLLVPLAISACTTPSKRAQDPREEQARPQPPKELRVERISTLVPFPRGLQLVDGKLYVLARGRVREYGGVSASIDDRAGTLFELDPEIAEPIQGEPGATVRGNGRVIAEPSAPPFRLWDRGASPPWKDRETDRPYCGLTWHGPTRSFYICAFSGVDKAEGEGSTFSKNLSDAILRYDTRTWKWYEVERHDIEKGGNYPHHDPRVGKPPHGWLNGPDNCLALGSSSLYAVSKDNSLLVRYDLCELTRDPEAGAPPSEVVLRDELVLSKGETLQFRGHSALAQHADWLYVASRTSSHVVRLRLDDELVPAQPLEIELVAQFDPYDPETKKSANLTDMSIGADGHVYVVSASPARIYRFLPDSHRVFDARGGKVQPYIDLARLTGNHKMKSENLLVDPAGRVYVTSGDAYASVHQGGSGGVVWRITPL